jgi:hypothetical protein
MPTLVLHGVREHNHGLLGLVVSARDQPVKDMDEILLAAAFWQMLELGQNHRLHFSMEYSQPEVLEGHLFASVGDQDA